MHDVFISYPHADAPADAAGHRWVASFKTALEAHHLHHFGRELDVFCDTGIQNGARWRDTIAKGLRQSKIFIAILSEAYFKSEWCRKELEEYIRLEHGLARGGAGIRPVYFATVPELEGGEIADKRLKALVAELRERQRTHDTDLRAWAKDGPRALMKLDAEKRLHALAISQTGLDEILPGLSALDRTLAERLDDAKLAEMAEPLSNITATYRHFVGRSQELAEIHHNLMDEQVQVVTALHGLGGQGKTAIARQYAHAYAGYYAAGGRWEAPCEGRANLAAVFDIINDVIWAKRPGDTAHPDYPRFAAARMGEDERSSLPDDQRLSRHLALLRGFTVDGWHERLARWTGAGGFRAAGPGWIGAKEPRMLVLLDNVDRASLLGETALSALGKPDWLEVLVTTRLGADEDIVAGDRIKSLAVEELPIADAVALLDTLKPIEEPEEADARALVEFLGRHTLSVELCGAYAAVRKQSFGALLQRFKAKGLTGLNELGKDSKTAQIVRHRSKQIGVIIEETIQDLSELERDILFLAAHFPPDSIRPDWLKMVAATRHADLNAEQQPGEPDNWSEALARLADRRLLLVPEEEASSGLRLHRLIGDQLRALRGMAADREPVVGFAVSLGMFLEQQDGGWQANPWMQPLGPPLALLCETLLAGGDDALLTGSLGVAADIEGARGRLSEALRLAELRQTASARLHAASPDSAQARRDLSVSQERIGDFYRQRGQPGDSDRALQAYEASLATAEALARDNPDSAEARRDLSVSQERIGDFFLQRGQPGDSDRALQAYEASLATREALARDNPDSAEARRDLSVSQNKIGDFYRQRGQPGDADQALQAYEASLATREALVRDNPDSAQARRDLSVSQERIGDFYRQRGQPGDSDRALQAYEASLATAEALARDNPDSAQARRDLSVSQNKIGDFYRQRGQPGDLDRALQAYEASLATAEALARDNPGSAEARRDLSVSQSQIGDFYRQRGQPGDAERALQAFEASLATDEALARDNPDSAQARRDLSVSQERIGDFYRRRGQPGDADRALQAYEASLATRETLARDNPDSLAASRDLAASLERMGNVMDQTGQPEAARGHRLRLLAMLEGFAAEGRPLDPAMRAALEHYRRLLSAPEVSDALIDAALGDADFVRQVADVLAAQTGETWATLNEARRRTVARGMLAAMMARQQQQPQGGGLEVDLDALGLDQQTLEAAFAAAQGEANDIATFKADLRRRLLAAGGNPEAVEALLAQIGDGA